MNEQIGLAGNLINQIRLFVFSTSHHRIPKLPSIRTKERQNFDASPATRVKLRNAVQKVSRQVMHMPSYSQLDAPNALFAVPLPRALPRDQ